jgi:DMSO/TMAO reductase YedYZ heme-binding membrane subunit
MQATFWFCNWKTLHKYVHDFICVFRIHLWLEDQLTFFAMKLLDSNTD